MHGRALLALVSFRFVLFVSYTLMLRRCWEVGRVYLGLLASLAGWLVLSGFVFGFSPLGGDGFGVLKV